MALFSRRRGLACSFCGRGEADVAKLVAGPRVYICDRCAAIAMRIMDAAGAAPRPPSPAGGMFGLLITRFVRRLDVGRRRGIECRVH